MEIRPVETFARVIALLGVLVVVGGVVMYFFGVVRSEPHRYAGESTPAPAPSPFSELPKHVPDAESSAVPTDTDVPSFQSDAVDSTASSSGTQANVFQAAPASGTPR